MSSSRIACSLIIVKSKWSWTVYTRRRPMAVQWIHTHAHTQRTYCGIIMDEKTSCRFSTQSRGKEAWADIRESVSVKEILAIILSRYFKIAHFLPGFFISCKRPCVCVCANAFMLSEGYMRDIMNWKLHFSFTGLGPFKPLKICRYVKNVCVYTHTYTGRPRLARYRLYSGYVSGWHSDR